MSLDQLRNSEMGSFRPNLADRIWYEVKLDSVSDSAVDSVRHEGVQPPCWTIPEKRLS